MNFYVFITALFTALVMVPFVRRWALIRRVVDKPDVRKVHSKRIPRLGGIAIFMAFLFTMLLYADVTPLIRGALAGGLVVFLTGMIDDLGGISPRVKLVGQIIGATVAVVVADIKIVHLGNLFAMGDIVLPLWLAAPFTIFAIVGLINAINLIDGLDGLAGGVSVIALTAFFVLGYIDNNVEVMILSAALLGAALGFLKYNFYPARIFMGDSGSLVLGFFLAYLAILLTQSPDSSIRPVLPGLILGVPIVDTLWVMGRRIFKGHQPFSPDKTHVHHKFLNLGFKHRFTVIIIYSISIFWATMVVFLSSAPDYLSLLLFLSGTVVMYAALQHVVSHPQRYLFLKSDSMTGLRDSKTYGRLATSVQAVVPVLFVMLMLCLAIAALFGGGDLWLSWQLGAGIIVIVLGLLLMTHDLHNQFLLVVFYIVGLVLIASVEIYSSRQLPAGISPDQVMNLIFVLIAAIVVIKIIFRLPGEFFISSVDVLILGISIFLSILFDRFGADFPLSDVLLKGILFYLGVKIVINHGGRLSTLLMMSMLAALVIVSVRIFLSVW